MRAAAALLGLLGLSSTVRADPTWPNDFDDFEEIMYQVFGFGARKFADLVSPCDNEPSPGRFASAEWLRTGFHDMATANNFLGTGGIDASLQYELDNDANGGPGFNRTLRFMAPFFNKKTSMADLIALGVYTSVRSCQGPAVPVRYGRVDATARGPTGVPRVHNNVFTFKQQFERMGFIPREMIQLVACGHSLGGVHSDPNDRIVPPGTLPDDVGALDSTPDLYDNHVVTDFLDGTTPDPLVTGPSVRLGHHSDFRIFTSDDNETVSGMADNGHYRNICRGMLGRMIDVVPKGVSLTAPIEPYDVKPVGMQLVLNSDAETLQWTGYIRVRITELPLRQIERLTITYKDRFGGSDCGGGKCSFSVTHRGIGTGFDEDFAFFPIDKSIPASSGISSFTISIKKAGGLAVEHDNNGNSYPIQDAIILQKPQSCLLQTSGSFTLTAAVRNDVTEHPINALIAYKTPQKNSPVPRLQQMSVEMVRDKCYGEYTFYSVDTTIPGGLSFESTIDITGGEHKEAFRYVDEIGGRCRPFEESRGCSSVGSGKSSTEMSDEPSSSVPPPTSVTGSEPSTSDSEPGEETSTFNDDTVTPPSWSEPLEETPTFDDGTITPPAWSESDFPDGTSGPSVSPSDVITSGSDSTKTLSDRISETWNEWGSSAWASSNDPDSSEAAPSSLTSRSPSDTVTSASESSAASQIGPYHRPTMGGYELVSCWKDEAGSRTLGDAFFAYDKMTLESCMANCTGYKYWGTEYGRECWCSNTLREGSSEAPLTDCNMACTGDDTQFCGAGNRLELYSTTAISTSVSPTGTLVLQPTVGAYSPMGCWREGDGAKALDAKATASPDMTLDKCEEFCGDYKYFGAEYANECYCGNKLHATSEEAALDECNMPCAGDQYQYCGAGNRLSVYVDDSKEVIEPKHPPTIGDYQFTGCRTEASGMRALSDDVLFSEEMTNEMCAEFCEGYPLFGTEYGGKCFCGSAFNEGSREVDEDECGMVCKGSEEELCGDRSRLSVYKLPGDEASEGELEGGESKGGESSEGELTGSE